MARWTNRPEGSNWGEFGPDDHLGRMNLLTPERRRRAVAEVREGIAFALSLPLDYPGGTALTGGLREPPKLFAGKARGNEVYNFDLRAQMPGCRDVSSDDGVVLYTQYSTQWDSFCHWGAVFDADGDGVAEKVYYNGWRAGEDIIGPDRDNAPHANALGVEHLAATGAQGRGVLIDLRTPYGAAGEPVDYDRLLRAIEMQKIEVLPGDFVCLHTGFDDMLLSMNKSPDLHVVEHWRLGLDGNDPKLLQWIADSGIVALCSDNPAVETMADIMAPRSGAADYTILPLHELCLFKLGIHLGELWLLSDLANWLRAHERSAFLLTAPPLRLPGAVGSPVTPVATV